MCHPDIRTSCQPEDAYIIFLDLSFIHCYPLRKFFKSKFQLVLKEKLKKLNLSKPENET